MGEPASPSRWGLSGADGGGPRGHGGHRAPSAQDRRLGHWASCTEHAEGPRLGGELRQPPQPAGPTLGAWPGVWGPLHKGGVPGFQPPSATVAHMGMGGHTERVQAPPGAPCWSRWLYRGRTTLRCALSHPAGLSRALSGHHGHPPSQPGHMQGAGGRAMDVTPSTRPGPEGHPSRLRVRAAPRRPARPPPAHVETTAEGPWAELPVGRAEGHSWSRDRTLRPGAGAEPPQVWGGGWGADAVRSQDRARGRTCGCSCPNARGHAQADGRRLRGPGSARRRCQRTSFPMTPAPTPRAHVHPPSRASEGRFCARQTCLQGPLSASVRPPTRGCLSAGLEINAVGKVVTMHRRGRRHAVGWPHRPPPEYCCAVPGDEDLERKARRSLMLRPAPPPGEDAVFISCQCRNRSPRPGQGGRGGGSSWVQVRP